MTAFYKIADDGYITAIGTNGNDSVTEITEIEYYDILSIIGDKPSSPEGYTHRLRADTLEWELVELPPVPDVEDEPTIEDKAEAYDILMGGASE